MKHHLGKESRAVRWLEKDRDLLLAEEAGQISHAGQVLLIDDCIDAHLGPVAARCNQRLDPAEREVERFRVATPLGLDRGIERTIETVMASKTRVSSGVFSAFPQQNLCLCCALIHDPDLLILDEPTTGVDPLSRRQFWELIDQIRVARPGMSVLVATAYMEEAARFDWLVATDAGHVLATGTPPELLSRTGTQSLEAGAPTTHLVMLAQGILYRGAGMSAVWPQFLALALIGTVLFGVALGRFRKTIGTMAYPPKQEHTEIPPHAPDCDHSRERRSDGRGTRRRPR